MGLEHKRYEELDINLVDKGIRKLIKNINKSLFLETTGCCEGHTHFDNYRTIHSTGYIQGIIHDKNQYEKFNKKFQKYMNTKNENQKPQIIDLTKSSNFHIVYSPAPLEDLSTNLFTFEDYLETSPIMGQKIILERKKFWDNFNKFIKRYQRKN
jgi:hypothetical protein